MSAISSQPRFAGVCDRPVELEPAREPAGRQHTVARDECVCAQAVDSPLAELFRLMAGDVELPDSPAPGTFGQPCAVAHREQEIAGDRRQPDVCIAGR
jgi:hypothetical protein